MAYDFQFETLTSGSAYNDELAASLRLESVFVLFNPMQFGLFTPQIHGKTGAGDEARTRDVHLGKVVLYQLSYTRSFERDNNAQPTAPRNLLIAPEAPKSLNPNRTFTASYDQTLYEKTIPPLHGLARAVWQLVSAGADGKSDCQPDSADGNNGRDSGDLNSCASITNGSTQCDV